MKLLKPTLLSLICAILLAGTARETRQVIAENRQQHAERVLREMIFGAELKQAGDAYDVLVNGQKTGTITAHSTTKGYNGRIDLLVAASLSGEIMNVRVTGHQETPGLGDKIDIQVSDWIIGFNQRSADNTRWQLRPAGDFDAISGATITSRAVIDAVHQAITP